MNHKPAPADQAMMAKQRSLAGAAFASSYLAMIDGSRHGGM